MPINKGDIKSFQRNGSNIPAAEIKAVVDNTDAIKAAAQLMVGNTAIATMLDQKFYIIEHPSGWIPSPQRVLAFDLDPEKTYIFAKESELN